MSSSKKKKQIVLEEDKYVECMEKIIERDFFPDYEHLKDQKDYLDASAQKNFEKMRHLALKYSSKPGLVRNPISAGNNTTQSPATFDTPVLKKENEEKDFKTLQSSLSLDNQPSDDQFYETNQISEKDRNLSLDKFLGKYTSEDTESLAAIMRKSEEALKIKHAWLYEAEEKHKQMCKEMLQLESSKKDQLAITDGSSKEDISLNERTDQISSSGPPPTIPLNGWEYKAKNHLMYYPEGHHVEDDEIFKKPQLIVHSNTRFNASPFQEQVSDEKIAQAMREKQALCGERVGHDGKSILPDQTPKVNGFSLVSDSPSPMPGIADESPLMTWGMVGSTPLLESSAGSVTPSPGPSFRFPEESLRDKLAHQMVDDLMKKKKKKKEKALKQVKASMLGTPRYRSSERLNTLSPAAQKLFGKRFNRGTDKALKASYTPSPCARRTPGALVTPRSTPTSSQRRSHHNTPLHQPHATTSSSITDDLLKLPESGSSQPEHRKKASDFF